MTDASRMTIQPYQDAYRDDLIFMVLEAKNALGRKPRLNEDLLDIQGSYLDQGGRFWLAISREDRVIGCVGYSPLPGTSEAFLHRLYVKADRKRQGIGSALLQTAEAEMRKNGVTTVRVHLGTLREQWQEAYSFYPKHGYWEYEPRYMMKRLEGGKHPMRVIVLSDSHGFIGRLSTVLTVAEQGGPIDAILHLGDGYYDLRDLKVSLPPVYQVAGNCDYSRAGTLDYVTLSNAKILLTHGHYQHVHDGTDDLLSLAVEENCRAALYGHTHVQKMKWERGILLLNPGAVQDGKYAVLNINALGAIDPELHTL